MAITEKLKPGVQPERQLQEPKIKLTHQLGIENIRDIARITGGEIPAYRSRRVYYNSEQGGLSRIVYPKHNSYIDFAAGPQTDDSSESIGAYLRVGQEEISLRNTAVFTTEGSVSFVTGPQRSQDSDQAMITEVLITKEGTLVAKIPYKEGDERIISRAAKRAQYLR